MSFQVPGGWQPSETTRAFAAGAAATGAIDADAEFAKFREYQFAQPIINPDKAALGWIRRAIEHSARRSNGHAAPSATAVTMTSQEEQALGRIRAFEDGSPGEYARLEAFLAGHRWWDAAERNYQIKRLDEAIRDRVDIFQFLDSEGRDH